MSDAANSASNKDISNFLVPISLSKTELERTLNERIDGNMFDNRITEDKLQIKVNKVDSIRLGLKEDTIVYRVPLRIHVSRAMFLTDVEAEGDIALDFETKYHLDSTWSINTETQLIDYEWIKEPQANVLGFKIPVTSIAERIIRTSSKNLTETIDKQVNENFDLKVHAQQAWKFLQTPFLVFPPYNVRFKITPTGLSMAPFKIENDMIVSTLFAQGHTQIGVGEQTNFVKNKPLLPLKIQDFGNANGFNLNMTADVPFAEAEKVILKNFKGEEYGFGKKKIVVEDLKLEKEGSIMNIKVQTSGDYDGWLLFKGETIYNDKKSQIEFKDLAFSLDTQNFLQKDAKWLLNGLFTNKLEGSLTYTLKEDMATIKNLIIAQITNYKIQDGIFLKGIIKDLSIKKAFLKEASIMIGVQLVGSVKVEIDSIP